MRSPLTHRFLFRCTTLAAFAAASLPAVCATPPDLTVTVNPVATNLPASDITTGNGGVSTYNSSYFQDGPTTTSTTTVERVQTPATRSAPGVAYVYEQTESQFIRTTVNYKEDSFSWSAAAQNIDYSGQKYIAISGAINSAQGGAVSLWLSSTGNFQTSPGLFGPTTPALPSFYFGHDIDHLSLLTSNFNSSTQNHSYNTSAWTTFDLVAGTPTTFSAVVYAPYLVSLGNFGLSFTKDYNFDRTDITVYRSSEKLVGAHAIPAVPEPNTYAMFLAGFIALAFVGRRQARSARTVY